MSVLLELKSPPILTIAMNVMKVSKLVLATTATRSPFRTPFARRAFASKATFRLNLPHDRCRTSVLPSRTSVIAILASSLFSVVRFEGSVGEAEYRMFSAKFSCVPSNHCGMLSIGIEVSTTWHSLVVGAMLKAWTDGPCCSYLRRSTRSHSTYLPRNRCGCHQHSNRTVGGTSTQLECEYSR